MQQKLLPPRLFLLCLISMIAIHLTFSPPPIWGSAVQTIAGIAIALGFLAITVLGARQFDRARTNINTFYKPDTLVTTGLFRFTRNPMYVGFSGALFGAAIALNCLTGLLIAIAFVVVADRWYIRYEERMMADTFGPAYADYRAKTRRWL
ncbi:MAG: isoprenylcysteine carboxylmethyltransferase family protein [Parvibaculum sp.]|uniref:methyltransferase family protein n=1 Tax=Parvibaculum sp. TaxID=2024848 RepID=UPI001E1872EE|nr:isoprenylcysteine carboxylmethyltransferase family protein [Parvibaculum sp.]MBX3489768.1 isoprenylcysteine carboxylmethyltransferase family protein [Parvibaculum sp.]MBX3494820.1 isoprenylcysteine carboxylmethyltransferase family protein [Parvibaculum sp.]MCW5726274.1 isoprenylcysteine carboxylmethyltransferase family protein [Parvibaculum sp.]